MKVLVVGGTGLIGGTTALLLRRRGHQVTVAARKPAAAGSELATMAFAPLDYMDLSQAAALLPNHRITREHKPFTFD